MWFDDLEPGQDWMGPWERIHQCGGCNGLITEYECPFCGWMVPPHDTTTRLIDGEEWKFVATVVHGAFTAVPSYLLGMMQSEWERPLNDDHWVHKIPAWLSAPASSQRTAVVLFFWTLFESLMEQFYLAAVPSGEEGGKLLKKYGMIGARMYALHEHLFGNSFFDDLKKLEECVVAEHLIETHTRRNDFIHGNVSAIDDDFVRRTVELLPDMQRAWVELYNLRCRGDKTIPLWRARAE